MQNQIISVTKIIDPEDLQSESGTEANSAIPKTHLNPVSTNRKNPEILKNK